MGERPWDAHIKAITSVVFVPDGGAITREGAYAFCGCTNLTSVTLPEGMTVLDRSSFEGCTVLTSVHFPTTLKAIPA